MRFVLALLVACLLSPLTAYADEAKRVIVSGTGGTRELALNNAFRHAVEQAVGMMVSSESYVKNLKDIQDKIFVASDGFIESYEVVSEDHDLTGYAVTVSAVVREKKLITSVNNVTGSTARFDGASAAANISLSADKSAQYHQLMVDALDDLLKNGVQFVYGNPVVYERDDGFYLDIGKLEIGFNAYWLNKAKQYRKQLGDDPDALVYLRALKGFPDPKRNGVANGNFSEWFVLQIQLKGEGNNTLRTLKILTPYRDQYRQCGDAVLIDELLGFRDFDLENKTITRMLTSPDSRDYCQLWVGPFKQETIQQMKNIELAILPIQNYGGQIPLLKPKQ